MNLTEVNDKLLEIAVQLPAKLQDQREAEARYNLRFYDLMLKSGMGNQEKRDAEANLVCQEEGLLEPVQVLRADVRSLYHMKDCFISIASNLRAMQVREEKHER